MNVGELLKMLEDGLKEGTITKESAVMVGLDSEIMRDKDGSFYPSTVTSMDTVQAIICEFPVEDEVPSHVELVLNTEDVKEFYETNELVVPE